jgi:hypothetical protein
MEIDVTMQLAPVFWGMIALLLVLAGAILASIDPELTEAYLGDPRLLFGAGAAAVMALAALLVARPEIAHGLSALLH